MSRTSYIFFPAIIALIAFLGVNPAHATASGAETAAPAETVIETDSAIIVEDPDTNAGTNEAAAVETGAEIEVDAETGTESGVDVEAETITPAGETTADVETDVETVEE